MCKYKASSVQITKGMDKDLLLEICNKINLSDLEINILVYYYCDRMSLSEVADTVNYSYDYVAELKSNSLKKLSSQI